MTDFSCFSVGPPIKCQDSTLRSHFTPFRILLPIIYDNLISFETLTSVAENSVKQQSSQMPCFEEVDVTEKFTLEQVMKAQRGSRGIALLFL